MRDTPLRAAERRSVRLQRSPSAPDTSSFAAAPKRISGTAQSLAHRSQQEPYPVDAFKQSTSTSQSGVCAPTRGVSSCFLCCCFSGGCLHVQNEVFWRCCCLIRFGGGVTGGRFFQSWRVEEHGMMGWVERVMVCRCACSAKRTCT